MLGAQSVPIIHQPLCPRPTWHPGGMGQAPSFLLLCPMGYGFEDAWGAADGGAGHPSGFMLQHWGHLEYPRARCHVWYHYQADAMGMGYLFLIDGPASMHFGQPVVCWA